MTKKAIWLLGILGITGVVLFPTVKRLVDKQVKKHRWECDCEKHFVDFKAKMEQFYTITDRSREYQKQNPGFDEEGTKLMSDWETNNPADSIRFKCAICLAEGYKPPKDLYIGYKTEWVPSMKK